MNERPVWQYALVAVIPVAFLGVLFLARSGNRNATVGLWIAVGVWFAGGMVAVALFP